MEDLTLKQSGFVREYVENGQNGTQAALAVYDTTDISTAANIASENLRIPKIENAIKSIADRIDDDLVVQQHRALLTHVDKEGILDGPTVSKAVDMAYKLKGSYAASKNEVTGKNGEALFPTQAEKERVLEAFRNR